MYGWIRNTITSFVYSTGRGGAAYKKICNPNARDWGAYMARWGKFYSVGTNIHINPGCNITDPALLRLGSNVGLSDCTLIGHDAVVALIEVCYGKQLDSVGFIDIKDNCFVGHGAIVMPRVTIGPDSVVAAGSVVTKDVPPGTVVGGNPARFICTTAEMIQRVEERCNAYPWIDLIKKREGAYDPALEPMLAEVRRQYFFGDNNNG
ncbi:acyltransferase [Pseudomonas shirazensis]|jgi:acetyltransferase-like isoleucine patch superfamily enzyme|uniref:Transferase n=3 Tax=Pseudomonas TaxID=286 RepID=A0A2S3WFA5_PSEPU|nr:MULTISPECIES: acyltransferase [Pseudomonas]AUF96449.1 acyltransferase [Pseudomonas sp. 02C 26]MBA1196565.1 acyltransferase [Pseudomonas plecoglossicida]MBA1320936.1 acyltransferase [Pseudomonas plecoglossicida]MBO0369466.1 acyltransferase [Pseudomonas putida]MBV4499999.1 acyltransferase [Pseudomonas shirazensis]